MNRLPFALAFFLSVPLTAQGLLIGPTPPDQRGLPVPEPWQRPGAPTVRIVRTAVHAEIVDGVATTSIDQVFHNDGPRDAEGTWFLPLPAGAIADGFTMTVGGKEISGEVLDAGRARSVYEQIVRQRRDPGLLEYAGEGMLRARIFPIPARGDVGVTVRLRQVLQPLGGIFEWVWPLRASRLGDAVCGPIGLDVRIKSQTALSTIIAPYATAEIRRIGEHEATVTLEASSEQYEDLRVLYGLSEQEFGLHMLAFRQMPDAGYFTLLLSPPRALGKDKAVPRRCVQLVVDTSGSMAGDKIEQAKAAVRMFLRSLRPTDLFQVVTFASAVQTFFEKPQLATEENLAAALQRVDRLAAMGGTNISGALQQALESRDPACRRRRRLLAADRVRHGWPADHGAHEPAADPRPHQGRGPAFDARVRARRRGRDRRAVARRPRAAASRRRGTSCATRRRSSSRSTRCARRSRSPALTDVEVRCDGLDAFDVHPTRTRDLFCGEMMQVVGRYRDSGKHTVRVRGKQNGAEREFVFEVDFPAASEQHSFVQTLWARQHIASLLDAIRRNGQKQELIDEGAEVGDALRHRHALHVAAHRRGGHAARGSHAGRTAMERQGRQGAGWRGRPWPHHGWPRWPLRTCAIGPRYRRLLGAGRRDAGRAHGSGQVVDGARQVPDRCRRRRRELGDGRRRLLPRQHPARREEGRPRQEHRDAAARSGPRLRRGRRRPRRARPARRLAEEGRRDRSVLGCLLRAAQGEPEAAGDPGARRAHRLPRR
jgi:Ca-activated chloride channel family protein